MGTIKIFVSSEFSGNFDIEREAIRNKINSNDGLKDTSLDYGMEQPKGTETVSLKKVEEADIIVLLVGYSKYGRIRAEGISLTHMEYRKAKECDKNILAYYFPTPDDSEHKIYIDNFKEEIINNDKNVPIEIEKSLPIYKQYLRFRAENISNDFMNNEHEKFKEAFGLKVLNTIINLKSEIITKLPIGVSNLKTSDNESIASYKKSLFEDVLPYISRSQYKKANHLGDSFKTEDELFKEIFSDSAVCDGILIKGEGGIGKTRLMLELGRMAENSDWTVLEIQRNFNDWNSLKLSENKRYCLLFDYAEQSKVFSYNMFDTFSSLYPLVKIKIIGNARNTYREDTPLVMRDFQIDQDDDYEKNYLQYVIKNILQFKGVQIENGDLDHFFKNIATKPSFAVFLINEKQNVLDKINFHGIRHINQYLQDRLKITLCKQTFSDIPSEVFKFLSILPMNEQDVQNKEFINSLEIDGWIKYEDGKFIHAFHNTILDELLISYLRTIIIKRNLDSFIRDIFDYSLTSDTFHNAIKTFNSMSELILNNSPKIVSEIPTFLITLFQQEQYIKAIKNNLEPFIKSSIFSDLNKLKFLLDNKLILEDSDDSIELLSKIMKKTGKNDSTKNDLIELVYRTIESKKILEKFQDFYQASFLIPAFYNFFTKEELQEISEKYYFDINEITLNWIDKYGGYYNADHVMKAYLINTDSPQDISSNVRGWLLKYPNLSHSYLIKAYLDAEYTLSNDILDFVINHLKKIRDHDKKGFSIMVPLYLKKQGDIELIKEDIVHWLKSNYEHERYSNILQAYLNNSRNIKPLAEDIVRWLHNNYEHVSFSYILKAYLDYGGDINPIKEDIIQILHSNHENKAYTVILQVYLDNGGSIDSVRLDNIHSIFAYVVDIFFKRKKKYQEFLPVCYSDIEALIDQYNICNIERENDIKYLFICSKFLKLSNITEKTKNKVLDQFQIFVDKDNYFLNQYKLPYFNPYNDFSEHGAETIVKQNIRNHYEDYVVNHLDNNFNCIVIFEEYLSEFKDQTVELLEKIKEDTLRISIKELNSAEKIDTYISLLSKLDIFDNVKLEKINDIYSLIYMQKLNKVEKIRGYVNSLEKLKKLDIENEQRTMKLLKKIREEALHISIKELYSRKRINEYINLLEDLGIFIDVKNLNLLKKINESVSQISTQQLNKVGEISEHLSLIEKLKKLDIENEQKIMDYLEKIKEFTRCISMRELNSAEIIDIYIGLIEKLDLLNDIKYSDLLEKINENVSQLILMDISALSKINKHIKMIEQIKCWNIVDEINIIPLLEKIKKYVLGIDLKESDSVENMFGYISSLESLQNANMLQDIKKHLSYITIEHIIKANPAKSDKLLKSYFQYSPYNNHTSKILFLEYINHLDHVADTYIDTKLCPIVNSYLENNDYGAEVSDTLKQLVLQNLTVNNIYQVIVICILNGENMDTFQYYIDSNQDLYETLLNEIHQYNTHAKRENLKEFEEFLSINHDTSIS